MYILKMGNVEKIEVISKGEENSLINIFGKEVYYNNKNIFEDLETARIAKKEYLIVKNFKRKHKGNKCPCCKRKFKSLTVDHIIPLYEFGGRNEIRKNKQIWENAWSEDNLQLFCEECNKMKSSMENKEFLKYYRKIDRAGLKLKEKKMHSMNRRTENKSQHRCKSPGYCLSSSKAKVSEDIIIKLAKMDSRVLFIK